MESGLQAGTCCDSMSVGQPTIERELENQLNVAEQRVADIKKLQVLLEATPNLKDALNLMGRLGVRRF